MNSDMSQQLVEKFKIDPVDAARLCAENGWETQVDIYLALATTLPAEEAATIRALAKQNAPSFAQFLVGSK